MTDRRRRDLFTPLLVALVFILVLAFQVFRPFLLTFAVAASVALLLVPLHRRLTRALRDRPTLAAGLIVTVTTIAVPLPVVVSLQILTRQALVFFDWIGPYLQPAELQRLWEQNLAARFPILREWQERGEGRLAPIVSGVLAQLAGMTNSLLQGVLAGFTHAL